jgi:hypothetical protein
MAPLAGIILTGPEARQTQSLPAVQSVYFQFSGEWIFIPEPDIPNGGRTFKHLSQLVNKS